MSPDNYSDFDSNRLNRAGYADRLSMVMLKKGKSAAHMRQTERGIGSQ